MSAWGNLAFPEDDTIGKEEMIELIKFIFENYKIMNDYCSP